MKFTDQTLKALAVSFMHDNFTSVGVPRYYDAVMADKLFELLKIVRDSDIENTERSVKT